jgi:hypothetical protein
VHSQYRFSIQSVGVGNQKHFRLVVALAEDGDAELIPVHQTAFARMVPLKQSCSTSAEAESELALLREWLEHRAHAEGVAIALNCETP